MNQQKTGEFLKRLRREKGLTQEQLAERFYVSSRTVSRWETGSNLPDLGTLIDLADFYDADIREIIDGERKSKMDHETRDTLKKAADYAAAQEQDGRSRVVYTALGVCVALILCTLLFIPRPGLLYGIISEEACHLITVVAYGLAVFLLIAYLRVLPFLEKPEREPVRTVRATVTAREIRSGTGSSGRSQLGYSFLVFFRTGDGRELELYAYDYEYGGLVEGMEGDLTYRGRYFVGFERTSE